jgi:hypothetical protein
MSHAGHLLLMCDVTDPTPTAGHAEKTACSPVAGAYPVYRAVAWKRVDQIRHNIFHFLRHLDWLKTFSLETVSVILIVNYF